MLKFEREKVLMDCQISGLIYAIWGNLVVSSFYLYPARASLRVEGASARMNGIGLE